MERILGELIPLSLGTAVPFEKEFTVLEKRKDYDVVVFNVRTLWRNYYDSFPVQDPAVKVILPGFITELQQVKSLCDNAKLNCGLYLPEYGYIKTMMPKAIPKQYTDKQKHYYASENAVARYLKGIAQKLNIFPVQLRLPVINHRSLMLTHTPIDLLNRYQFAELKLIDSYTGTIKSHVDWMSKITNNPDYVRIPFNVLSLTVFGDGHYISGYPLRYRKALKLLSENNNWTPLTTKEKIIQNLKTYPDQAMSAELLRMFNVTIV
jgi:hypothetical protein